MSDTLYLAFSRKNDIPSKNIKFFSGFKLLNRWWSRFLLLFPLFLSVPHLIHFCGDFIHFRCNFIHFLKKCIPIYSIIVAQFLEFPFQLKNFGFQVLDLIFKVHVH